MSFDSLGLAEPLLRAVREQGYTIPTPIQAQAIPLVLQGGDLLGGAQTGTGKTAGFVLPMLQRLMAAPTPSRAMPRGRVPIRALILTPTRELAAQVEESVRNYGKYSQLTSMVMFGGVGMQPQIDKLRRGVDILVATPGRLLDHAGQRTLDLSRIEIFVLDEADRMLDMGFIHDIKKVLAIVPAKKQSLLFTATFSDEIKALADRLLNKPALIEVARRNQTADTIAQKVHPVGREMKKDLLAHLIKDERLAAGAGLHAHEARREPAGRPAERARASARWRSTATRARPRAPRRWPTSRRATCTCLVATDIAARGLDIDQLPHVVNYELPNVPEDYVHRIGRTGRAGSQGEAVSLVCVDENGFLRDIEKLIKREIPKEVDRRLRAACQRTARADRARPDGDRRRRRSRWNAQQFGTRRRRRARRRAAQRCAPRRCSVGPSWPWRASVAHDPQFGWPARCTSAAAARQDAGPRDGRRPSRLVQPKR